MATARWYYCEKCKKETGLRITLFKSLLSFTEYGPSQCTDCGTSQNLLLRFNFGLDVGKRTCRVTHTFIPERECSWHDNEGSKVRFFPFLVVLEFGEERDKGIWLPYWHTVTSEKGVYTKYGQWAPFMDQDLFESLSRQAMQAGCLRLSKRSENET